MEIYIMYSAGYYKIGIAQDVEKRLKALETGNPHPIKVIDAIEISSREKAISIETKIHERLSDWNKSGEWFDLTKDSIEILNRTLAQNKICKGYSLNYENDDQNPPIITIQRKMAPYRKMKEKYESEKSEKEYWKQQYRKESIGQETVKQAVNTLP